MAAEKKQKKAKPTAADKAAARLIKKKLYAMGDERPTQDELVAEWVKTGGRGSQSAMSQYINGDIPHNLRSVMFFARVLKCDPRELYPGLPGLDDVATTPRDEARKGAPLIEDPFDDDDLAILRKLLGLPDEMREAITDVISNAYTMASERRRRRPPRKEFEPKKSG